MQTQQLLEALKGYSNFNGVFPRDLLGNFAYRPGGYIVNTDPSDKPGEHWVALFFDEQHVGEYFDPYGFAPMHEEIYNFLNQHSSSKWTYNKQQLQNILSISCCYFCYLYQMFRLNGLSLADLQDFFTNKTVINEILLNYYACLFEIK